MFDDLSDPIVMAKAMQWEIVETEDPIEASFKGNDSVATLNLLHDDILRAGRHLVVRALGGYAFNIWNEELQRHVAIEYDHQIVASGKYEGRFGFLQNLGQPPIKTIFFTLRDARVVEAERGMSADSDIQADKITGRLILPVLSVDNIRAA